MSREALTRTPGALPCTEKPGLVVDLEAAVTRGEEDGTIAQDVEMEVVVVL